MFTVNDVNDTPPHLHSQKNAVCGRPRKKPITRPYVNSRAPSWRRECEPKTADINKLGWRPNTDADQHYVESGLLPPLGS